MESDAERGSAQYLYRTLTPSPRHRHRVSAYLVLRFSDSNVVARIEPLGLVHNSIGEQALAIHRLRRDLVVAGSWRPRAGLENSGRPTKSGDGVGRPLGGRDRRRSGDLTLFRRALYQLSYST